MDIPAIPKIFIIVLNYNGKKTILDCINSIYDSTYSNFEVVIVDNNSTDGSFELIKKTFFKANIIRNSKNIGFAAGNNIGIRFALEKFADYIFLLNNDATIESDMLSLLMNEMRKNSSASIISPLILKEKRGAVWFAGGRILWSKMRAAHLDTPKNKSLSYQIEYASGCAMLIKNTVFKKIGLFDENFFLYYEDVDFSLRAKRAGFGIFLLPNAYAYHKELSNQNNSQKIYWLVISALIFFKKNSSFLQSIWITFYFSLRKIKNFYTIYIKNDAVALQVKKAYEDYKKYSS